MNRGLQADASTLRQKKGGEVGKPLFMTKQIKNGVSHKYCPDGQLHRKQWFECSPGAWKCHRCGCIYSVVGIFGMDFVTAGSLSVIEDFDTCPTT